MTRRWLVELSSLLSHQEESKKQGPTSGSLLYSPMSTSFLILLFCCQILRTTAPSLYCTSVYLLGKYYCYKSEVQELKIWRYLRHMDISQKYGDISEIWTYLRNMEISQKYGDTSEIWRYLSNMEISITICPKKYLILNQQTVKFFQRPNFKNIYKYFL